MKKILLIFLVSLLFSFSSNKNDLKSKLLEVYSTEQVNTILKEENRKKYFEALLFKSFYVEDLGSKDFPEIYAVLTEVEISNKAGEVKKITANRLLSSIKDGSFNILTLNIERNLNKTKSFQIGNSKKVFHLLSHNQINKIAKQ